MKTPTLEEQVDRYNSTHTTECVDSVCDGLSCEHFEQALLTAEKRGADSVLTLIETRLQDKEGATIIREAITKINK